MPELPSGTVTFLFTDIEGSTRLLEELGERYAKTLADHRLVLQNACEGRGGVLVDTQGDATFYAFPSATAALAAAADAQRDLAIPVRMGIHTGEPEQTDEGYVGIDVHRAARIAAAGHGGQVLVSDTTARLVNDELRDLGVHRLKDVGELRIYQLGDGSFPPPKTLSATNLPLPPTPLLGRKKELADVLGLLQDGTRLLTVTGPGGIGKTRFALEIAAELLERFVDGVWLVDLSALRDPELVEPTIADALGAKGELARYIQNRELLLVLDNFEQVSDAAPGIADLLDRSSSSRLLITSREPLHVAGEREYQLRPLAESPAIELFRQRAQAIEADFDAGYAELAEICRRLDNLPLAIELAAARTRTLSAQQLLERLAARLPLLASRARDLPERQRTLRATIEWSYDLLSPEEQALFRRLAVFAGGFTLEAAEEVAGADLDTLESLVERSLVRSDGERFSMLETIREYALETLEEAGDGEEVRKRHLAHFVDLLERADLGGPDQPRWLRRLDDEIDNVRAALAFADRRDDERLLRLTAARAFAEFAGRRGYVEEARAWAERALMRHAEQPLLRRRTLHSAAWLAQLQGDFAAVARFASEGLEDAEREGDREDAAYFLRRLADTATRHGGYDAAVRLYDDAIRVSRELGDSHGVAASLVNLGELELGERHLERAEALFEEALGVYNEVGDDQGVLITVHNLGFVALANNRLDEADERLAESVARASEVGDARLLGSALVGVAAVAAGRGHDEAAGRVLGAAARLHEESGHLLEPVEEAVHDRLLADLDERLGREALESALAEGRRLERDNAVRYALEATRA
jgi:predicted ATPase